MCETFMKTLVKTTKGTKAGGIGNTYLENAQLERIGLLVKAVAFSLWQMAQLPDLPQSKSEKRKSCSMM